MTYILLDAGDHFFWAHCPWYWLWTLGAFLLGSLLTWLLLRNDRGTVDNSALIAERDRYRAAATKWENDYKSLQAQLNEARKAEADLRAGLATCDADKAALQQEIANVKASQAAAFAAGAGAGAAGNAALSGLAGAGRDMAEGDVDNFDAGNTTRVAALDLGAGSSGGSIYTGLFATDNLQIIEGIGPKVEQVLKSNNVGDWSTLAGSDVAELRRVLTDAGNNFGLSDPTSWPHQASLAAAGDWDELIKYQKFTDGGRETVGDFESDSKFEKLATKMLGFSSASPTDLKVVEGVGPKIESLLKADGINTWSDLAGADQDRLQTILDNAGSRFKMAIPRTWPEQATLAAAGDWKALKDLQNELRGGN